MKTRTKESLFSALVVFGAIAAAVYFATAHALQYAPIRSPDNSGTASYQAIDHDALQNFVLAEHIDWSQDTGGTAINAANIPASIPRLTGTPADNQIAVWTGSTTIEGADVSFEVIPDPGAATRFSFTPLEADTDSFWTVNGSGTKAKNGALAFGFTGGASTSELQGYVSGDEAGLFVFSNGRSTQATSKIWLDATGGTTTNAIEFWTADTLRASITSAGLTMQAGTVISGADLLGTTGLDDGSDTPGAGELVTVDPADTTQFAYLALPTEGTNGCAGAADKLLLNTTTHSLFCSIDAGAGGGMTSWTLAGTAGTPQTISDGNTATVAAGTGITTTAGATDTVTVAIDAAGAETALEAVLDLQDLQGAVTDAQVPDSITVSYAAAAGTATSATSATSATTATSASTATALAANGANCTAGNLPRGVDASGAAEGCAAVAMTSEVTGILPIANGGTGQSALASVNANSLGSGSATNGQVLTANGAGITSWTTPGAASEVNNLESVTTGIASGELVIGSGASTAVYAKISAQTEETAPASGDLLLGEESGGAVRKFDVGKLPRSGTKTIWIDAGAFVPRETNGPAADSTEYATNDVAVDKLLFDSVTEEGAAAKFTLDGWDLGGIKVKIYWAATTGSTATNGVTWGLACQAFSNDDPLDNAFPASVDTDDTVIAVGDLHVTSAASITVAGTPAADDLVACEVTRVVGDTNDDESQDAAFLGMQVQYTLAPITAW